MTRSGIGPVFVAVALLASIATARPAVAQDRQGNDTAGDWIVTHSATFGEWDSVCDERTDDGSLNQRCYIRYVDVFSPRPAFAAHFLFVTPQPDGVRIEYGSEPGTRFVPGGHRIERDGAVQWQARQAPCLQGGSCVFEGADAARLRDQMIAGGEWRFDFADRHGRLQSLGWDLGQFAVAEADFERESLKRGLR